MHKEYMVCVAKCSQNCCSKHIDNMKDLPKRLGVPLYKTDRSNTCSQYRHQCDQDE